MKGMSQRMLGSPTQIEPQQVREIRPALVSAQRLFPPRYTPSHALPILGSHPTPSSSSASTSSKDNIR